MNSFDYFCEEFFDDNDTLEVCERCLGVRITSLTWAKLNHYMLAFFLKIKNKDFELDRNRVFGVSFDYCFIVNIFLNTSQAQKSGVLSKTPDFLT